MVSIEPGRDRPLTAEAAVAAFTSLSSLRVKAWPAAAWKKAAPLGASMAADMAPSACSAAFFFGAMAAAIAPIAATAACSWASAAS